MVGGEPSGFIAVWSSHAEIEASRHMRSRAMPPDLVRERLGLSLSPTGSDPERFEGTEPQDRQILADAVSSGTKFLITEDVDDYGFDDLAGVEISAVTPDLFLAERLTSEAYRVSINLFVERQVNPPTSAEEFHSALGRQHPRLVSAQAHMFNQMPQMPLHAEPAVVFRGTRCLRSERIVEDSSSLVDGIAT